MALAFGSRSGHFSTSCSAYPWPAFTGTESSSAAAGSKQEPSWAKTSKLHRQNIKKNQVCYACHNCHFWHTSRLWAFGILELGKRCKFVLSRWTTRALSRRPSGSRCPYLPPSSPCTPWYTSPSSWTASTALATSTKNGWKNSSPSREAYFRSSTDACRARACSTLWTTWRSTAGGDFGMVSFTRGRTWSLGSSRRVLLGCCSLVPLS